ncbi:MAG TPA: hypothetical protein VJ936_03640, partial [Desulfobacteraceae bacterium]|nr:hypothetical protein [Desulfobacteraceae bacterium]
MKTHGHLAIALAIALGIHAAIFFVLPGILPNEKKREIFAGDSVEITMAAVKPPKDGTGSPEIPPVNKKKQRQTTEIPPAPQPPERKRKLPNARKSTFPEPEPVTTPDLQPAVPSPVLP